MKNAPVQGYQPIVADKLLFVLVAHKDDSNPATPSDKALPVNNFHASAIRATCATRSMIALAFALAFALALALALANP